MLRMESLARRMAGEEVYGRGEGGRASGWCDRRRCRGEGEIETNDSLCQPLKLNGLKKITLKFPSFYKYS